MEERRLKTILSHLSACPFSKRGESSMLTKEDNPSLRSTHLHHVSCTAMSRSWSGSNPKGSDCLSVVDDSPLRCDACRSASNEESLSRGRSLASLNEGRCGERRCLTGNLFKKLDENVCLHEKDVRPIHTEGCNFEVRGLNLLQVQKSSYFLSNCSSSDAPKLEWSLHCKSLHLKDELALGFEKKQMENSCSLYSDERTYRHHNEILSLSDSSSKDDCHQQPVHEPQIACRTFNSIENTDDSTIKASKGMPTPAVQTTKIKNEAMGSISRNNVMTGQRRCIVDDCVFCLIVQGQSPAFKLYEDDMCVCILDVHPLSHGHSLLIPKSHFTSLELTPPEVAAAMCAIVPLISMAIMQATNCDSFNLLVNSGKAAGQVVFHTHFHIIPRRVGDHLWNSEDGNRSSLPLGHETALLVQQIRRNLSNKCL